MIIERTILRLETTVQILKVERFNWYHTAESDLLTIEAFHCMVKSLSVSILRLRCIRWLWEVNNYKIR